MATWSGLKCCASSAVARVLHRRHHAVAADGDDAVAVAQRHLHLAQLAAARRRASPARRCRGRRGPAGGARRAARRRRRSRRSGRRRPRSRRPCRCPRACDRRRSRGRGCRCARSALPIENSTALPRPPPASTHRLAAPGSPSACRSGPSPRPARPARGSRTGASCRPSPARSATAGPSALSTHAPVSARPSIIRRRAVRRSRDSASKFCRRKNCPGSKCRAAAGARTTTSTMVGVSRSTARTVGAQLVVELARRTPARRRRAPAAPSASQPGDLVARTAPRRAARRPWPRPSPARPSRRSTGWLSP